MRSAALLKNSVVAYCLSIIIIIIIIIIITSNEMQPPILRCANNYIYSIRY
jgi:hypothetical protein